LAHSRAYSIVVRSRQASPGFDGMGLVYPRQP